MSRVFVSRSTGAGVYVFSDDHCPPHVHARHRGDGWIARVEFSFISGAVRLLSIVPSKNSPLQRMVNRLLDDIEAELSACRRAWWTTRQTVCLTGQWARVLASEAIELLPEPVTDARRIAEAAYDPERGCLRVTFEDGTTLDTSTLL